MKHKPIYLDGVNVSECRYFLKDTEGQDYNTDEFVKGCCEAKGSCIGYEFAGYGLCRGDKDCYFKQLARKTQECEELKKQLMQKSEVDMFFNTPIEGWSNDPCGICPHKAENEELKKCYKNNSALLDFEETNTTKLVNKVMKLEKTLIEIKEIAKEAGNTQYLTFPDFDLKQNAKMLMGQFNGYLQQILQKISEVDND